MNTSMFLGFIRALLLAALVCCGLASAKRGAAAPGDEHWSPQFGWPGVTNSVYGLAFNGTKLYAGGVYAPPGGVTNNHVDVWDGTNWSVIDGLSGGLIVVYDFAFIGNDVYVGGVFSRAGGVAARGLARWNGAAWSDVGGFAGVVAALAVDGNNLYVGGNFTNAGGVNATNIAQWNGAEWSALGPGLGPNNAAIINVAALAVRNGEVYAGGSFTNAGGQSVQGLARWDGASWSDVGGSVNGSVSALAFNGTDLYAGGKFSLAGAVNATNIARWNGSSWSALGSGTSDSVTAVGVVGTDVYVGGSFISAGAVSARGIAKWDGAVWSALGSGMNDIVGHIVVRGTNLYVGGNFTQADNLIVNHVARWDGNSWSGLGPPGTINGLSFFSRAVAAGGGNVYAGGFFTGAGKVRASRIARWDGTNWSPLGGGIKGTNEGNGTVISAIAVSGSNVYVGGVFTNAGGVGANSIARWNGASWSALGAGIPGSVQAIAVRGKDVFAGGNFTMDLGGGTATNIAHWDGSTWLALPGLSFAGTSNSFFVNAIAVHSNDVYVGGSFFAGNFSGQRSTNIVRNDGIDWMPLGSGVNSNVNAIVVSGSEVYVGGRFTDASGVSANRIAKWDGSNWSALGAGVSTVSVLSIAVLGSNVYVGGSFTNAGGVPVNRLAKWDGSSWSGLGSGLSMLPGNPSAASLAISGDDLYMAGTFIGAGQKASLYFARWNEQLDFDQPPLMLLSNPHSAVNGHFQFRVTANGVPSYVIEATSNFNSWTPLLTNNLSPFDFQDTASPSARRFYRTRQQ